MKDSMPTSAIYVPLFLLSAIWLMYILQLGGLGSNNCLGILPRHTQSIKGIFLSPLLHSTNGFNHIINNSVPLFVLLFFSFAVYKNLAYAVLVFGWILTGSIVWLFGDLSILGKAQSGCHIGASGVVYLLASFLFFSGWFRKSINTAAIALIVAFLYGSLIWGIFPDSIIKFQNTPERISWESHLAGFVVGLAMAIAFRKIGPQKKQYPWQTTNGLTPQEQALWEAYLGSLPEGEEPKTYEQIWAEFKEKNKRKRWDDLL